ncbi:hypothetical protein N5853_02230 [Bartonella sp. HY329]|uniref:ImuA family protein n=1 Tax=unclassified Bartonella TaxID=2645622 RepID=UPI0021C609FC|nr:MULTISPECIES: hypothetical protein [unclassified Bartonella]UXM95476.1 hypothetical protein N5853_02230 [Bartonella sp. HY329]UXN09802.1 hypothetical protein N5852_02240 [Bartonella sp. HY328]
MDQANLNKLRQQIAKMEGRPAAQILSNNQIDHFHKADANYNHQSLNNVEFTHFCLGLSEADEIIKPILRGSLHEIVPAPSHWQAAYGFVLALILRANKGPSLQPLIWIEDDGILFEYGGLNPYGIIAMGLDPSQLILIRCAHLTDVLKAGDDALQLKNISGVVLSLSDSCKALDFTTSRRLHLASEKNNIPAFMLMAKNAPKTSSAFTRWRIASGQSISSGAMAPGAPFFDVELIRNRSGGIGHWSMEWNFHDKTFSEPTLSRPLFSIPTNQSDHAFKAKKHAS